MRAHRLPLIAVPLLLVASCAPKPASPPPVQAVFVEQPVPDAPACVRPAEAAAFDMAAAKVRLYVLARNCKSIDSYNTVVTKFRPALQAHDKVLAAYFARTTKGRGAQAAKDDYETGLANAQSQRYGFDEASACASAPSYFTQMSAAKTTAELDGMAHTLALSQPIKLTPCT